MPSDNEAIEVYERNGIILCPGKAGKSRVFASKFFFKFQLNSMNDEGERQKKNESSICYILHYYSYIYMCFIYHQFKRILATASYSVQFIKLFSKKIKHFKATLNVTTKHHLNTVIIHLKRILLTF